LHYVKQHLWCYEYDYNCSRYSLVMPGAHLGGLFGCHDRPLCTAGTEH